jgi:hypothetical protein
MGPATVSSPPRYDPPMTEQTPDYTSRVRITRQGGPQRLAYLPALDEPVAFGVHSEVAAHYHVDPAKVPPRPTTLDYVVAAAGG